MVYIEGGLWGCIVIMAAFMIQVVAFGTSQCIGVYNVEFLEYFESSATAVSLVGSINLGLFLGAGPLASILMTRWSCRQIALVGAVLSNIGVLTMPFAPNLLFMYVFYGIISGFGYCLLYVPSHVLSGLYFYKQRSLATGIATAGSGMGASIFPVLFHFLIEHYGWRGSFFLVAGLNLHSFVFAALLRPVPDDLVKRLKRIELEDIQNQSFGYRSDTDILPMTDVDKSREIEIPKDIEKDEEIQDDVGTSLLKKNNAIETEIQTIHVDNDVKNGLELDSERTETVYVHSDELNSHSDREDDTLLEQLKNHFCTIFTFDFLVYCLSNIFWNAGIGILLIFLPKYMDTIGINREDASIAFTALGAGACFGCVAGGVLGNIKYFDRIILYTGANFGVAVVTVIMNTEYFHTFAGMFILSLINGFIIGIILGLLVVVTSDLLGTEALSDGFGYLMFCNGAGIFAGPPLAGALIDATSELSTGLFVSGIITALGGLSMCAVPIRRKLTGFTGVATNIDMEIEIK